MQPVDTIRGVRMLPDSVIRRLGALGDVPSELETSNSSLKVESHIHGNVNVWFGGGDTHVPHGYDGLYPTPGKVIRAGSGMPSIIRRERC
jgi:hypothetical protein